MKLIVQRVSRATVEVDGYVESRIGSGLVLSVALRAGDTQEKAQKLAARVVKLKLWPEMFDPDKLWSSNVVDNGFEVLVLCQQSLCANFPQLTPNQQGALGEPEAKVLFEAFVAQLRKEYQEEMVVAAPFETTNMRVEATQDGPGMFELDTSAVVAKPNGPNVSQATPSELGSFSKIPEGPPTRKNPSAVKEEEEVQEAYPSRRRPDWSGRAAPNMPADGGRARYGSHGPQSPSWGLMSYKAGSSYAGGKKGSGKKGGHKGGPRSYGIASLDESAKLHGSRGGYDYGQLSAMPDAQMKVGSVKTEQDEEHAKRRASAMGSVLKRPKGTPTVAPLCPAQCEDDAEVWEDL